MFVGRENVLWLQKGRRSDRCLRLGWKAKRLDWSGIQPAQSIDSTVSDRGVVKCRLVDVGIFRLLLHGTPLAVNALRQRQSVHTRVVAQYSKVQQTVFEVWSLFRTKFTWRRRLWLTNRAAVLKELIKVAIDNVGIWWWEIVCRAQRRGVTIDFIAIESP